ncbi:hypothetical protein [Raoultella ornithinolytica]|uniref:hypothetical protein n=1 Tax=Raoultella ornithinolytica TaxID=54291 RepID=UPI0021B0094A|nr:hypothetical protein [Raoultella ornithinolytica]MCT4737211.1 hypothetical protein [Raoultella ornithinolytica]
MTLTKQQKGEHGFLPILPRAAQLSLGLVVLCWVFPALAAGDVTISTEITSGNCSAAVSPATLSLGANGKIDPTAAVGKDWVFLGQNAITVTLTCTGGVAPSGAGVPAITVKPKSGTAQLASAGLFSAATATTAKGFGVAISNAVVSSMDKSKLITVAAPYVNVGTTGTLPTNGSTWKLPVAVACGATTACAASNLGPGKVSATFVVDFSYH